MYEIIRTSYIKSLNIGVVLPQVVLMCVRLHDIASKYILKYMPKVVSYETPWSGDKNNYFLQERKEEFIYANYLC